MTCLTCGVWSDFSERLDDSERSTRPATFDRLEVLGSSGDWASACRCPECGALFEWYRERDSDTGIRTESVTRREGERAIGLILDALEWPVVVTKPALMESLSKWLVRPSLDELRSAATFDRVALGRIVVLGREAVALTPRLEAHVVSELGARALAAIGAFEILERAARAGARSALRALARSGPVGVETTLVTVLNDERDPSARMEAAAGLGRLGCAREVLFSTMSTVQDTQVVEACRDALAAMKETNSLLQGLESPSWSVRRAAAEGLGLAGVKERAIIEALRQSVLRPRNATIVVTASFVALQQLGEPRDDLGALLRLAQTSGGVEPRAIAACEEHLGRGA